MTDRLIDETAVSLAARLQARELSARQVLSAHLDQIDEVNPQVNAIVARRDRDELLDEADRLDGGDVVGPLHGLPVAVKDLQDVAGIPTRAGSVVTSTRPAATDSLVAARMRAAGAIIIGKTNTPEFGTGSHTFNDVFGLTRNPWNLDRSAGGSSGGAAAALAARMLPIADGSDYGGSLRNPAGFCNVVGLRPGVGRVPVPRGRPDLHRRLGVEGPMARTVGDAALLLSVLAGPHDQDPLSLPHEPGLADPLPSTTAARLGWLGDLDLFPVEPEVLTLCQTAAWGIEQAGGRATPVTVDMTDAMPVFRVLRGTSWAELAAGIPDTARSKMKRTVNENIDYGLALTDDMINDALERRRVLETKIDAAFENHEVLALPTAQVEPFPADWEYPTEVAGTPMDSYFDWMSVCCVITATGCPAISIPAGFTSGGLPVGLQLVAPTGQERRLLEIAAAIETANPLHRRVPEIA